MFDIGDFDFDKLERTELVAAIAVPIATAPVATAPIAPAPIAAAPGSILFADGDDIVQQALAEAEAAPVKPMSARQRELLKKFKNMSAVTLDRITSSAQASRVIDAIMSARNRHGALVAAAH